MKNYRITVNGNTYDVQVEELNGAVATKAPTVTQATPVAAPTPAAAPTATQLLLLQVLKAVQK